MSANNRITEICLPECGPCEQLEIVLALIEIILQTHTHTKIQNKKQ